MKTKKTSITQYAIYIYFSPMVGDPKKQLRPVAIFTDIEKAKALQEDCLADEPWVDEPVSTENGATKRYKKYFKKDSYLELFYPIKKWNPKKFGEDIKPQKHTGYLVEKFVPEIDEKLLKFKLDQSSFQYELDPTNQPS